MSYHQLPSSAYPYQSLQPSKNYQPANGWFWLLLFLHVLLAFAMRSFSMVATIHALLTLFIGIFFALTSDTPVRTIYVVGYIIGAEVLWRMTDAGMFYEFGKYAMVLLLGLSFLHLRMRFRFLPIIYMTLLSISIPLTWNAWFVITSFRDLVSFNLSGPLALAVGLLFFQQVRLTTSEVHNLLRIILVPILSMSTLVIYTMTRITTSRAIIYTDNSNFATSGGFGPNQVSAIFGLGALLCWLLVLASSSLNLDRWLILALGILFFAQSLMTFSRGGVVNFIVAALIATFYFSKNEGRMVRILFVLGFVVLTAGYFILPRLNEATGGMLRERYTDVDTTGRVDIARLDLQIWQDNIILGVGPGLSAYYRITSMDGVLVAAHTEYTRILAEHGMFGLFSLLILLGLCFYVWRQPTSTWNKGIALACMAWAVVEMGHAAMRVTAISFLFSIAFAIILPQPDNEITSAEIGLFESKHECAQS